MFLFMCLYKENVVRKLDRYVPYVIFFVTFYKQLFYPHYYYIITIRLTQYESVGKYYNMSHDSCIRILVAVVGRSAEQYNIVTRVVSRDNDDVYKPEPQARANVVLCN